MGFGDTMSALGKGLVQAGGQPAPQFQADSDGQIGQVPQEGTPGQLFKNLLAGALTGLAGGAGARNFGEGVGQGAKAEINTLDQQRAQAEKQAQQNFENQQTKSANDDRHAMHMAQIANLNLQNAKMTSDFDFDKKLRPFKLSEAEETARGASLDNQKRIADLGLTNPVKIDTYPDASTPEGQQLVNDISQGKKYFSPNFDGTGVLYDLPPRPFEQVVPDKDYIVKTPVLNPKTNTVEDKVVGTLKAGTYTLGQAIAQDQSYTKTKAGLLDSQFSIQAHQSESGLRFAQARELNAKLGEDAAGRKAQADWGKALAASNYDIPKAVEVLRTNAPDSYGRFAAAEAVDFQRNGETVTQGDGENKVTIRRQRMFTQPTAASGSALSPDLQKNVLAQAQKDVAAGKSRDDIQANLKQALGPQADQMMQYLDAQGVFRAVQPSVWDRPGFSTQMN